MEIGSSWAWLLAAVAAIAVLLRVAVLGEKRLARHWPDFHARWSERWYVQHTLAASMAAVGLGCAGYAHGLPGGFGSFAIYLAWAASAAALAYLARWILIAVLVCLCPLLLPEVIGGLLHAWRHRRDRVPSPSDWLPPGGARLGGPAPCDRES